MTKHVAVLMGGWSAEREVSLSSGAAVARALGELGYKVTTLDAQHDVAQQLAALRPDVVFNALHGRWGEDGCVQGVLEVLQIPYTHSGVLASALAMDKPMARRVFAEHGMRIAEGRVVSKAEALKGDPMARPYVMKPINEGSSVGVKIMLKGENATFADENWPFGEEVLVERYIPGREIQVATLGDAKNGCRALGAIEIRPRGRFYDYEAKYTDGKAEHLMPAPLPKDVYDEVMGLAVTAHLALGCRGLARTDFRYDDTSLSPSPLEGEGRDGGFLDAARKNPSPQPPPSRGGGVFYILEVNTQPGMTPLSLSPEIASHAGIGFAQLVDILVKTARIGA